MTASLRLIQVLYCGPHPMPASRCRCGEYKRYISLFLKTPRHFFWFWRNLVHPGWFLGVFLGRPQTRNLSHPSPPVGVFPSQWVGRESIIHGTPPKVRELSSFLDDFTISQHTQLDLEDESTGRSYPVSSSTPERGLSEMMHTVEKILKTWSAAAALNWWQSKVPWMPQQKPSRPLIWGPNCSVRRPSQRQLGGCQNRRGK